MEKGNLLFLIIYSVALVISVYLIGDIFSIDLPLCNFTLLEY